MSDTAPTAPTERFHGRNRIGSRAMRTLVSAVAAGELGSTTESVGVELVDDDGALAVTVSAPVGVPSLTALTAGRSAPAAAPTVLERAGAARSTIRDRVQALTGSTIGVVNLRLTAARIDGDERVR